MPLALFPAVKLLKISLVIFIVLLVSYSAVFWLRQPSRVYESYEKATSILGIKEEAEVSQPDIIPVSKDFSLVIPKIKVNVPVIANVDGGNPREYLWRVTQGVAHFKHREFTNVIVDGALPGEKGNIFLFGHSQIPGGDTGEYKGVFNNLHKLTTGDRIVVVYQGQSYHYQVVEGKVVSKKALEYLAPTEEEVLTLMTCWPLGLDVNRYIVRAQRVARAAGNE
ncbi:hypothetical protein B5M47_00140 [candidate division CPR3 bacterium 4484_211]|uniref:Sortase n=1 Tax=candidate division CPR3 bacterium 4484_211 TaxID=1968527 RepID=A0A1W9P010_UNCC3|nr:MAG: hypothetical protein B5M47_00140 [candidate division CPR3 bacterium 4484_211]